MNLYRVTVRLFLAVVGTGFMVGCSLFADDPRGLRSLGSGLPADVTFGAYVDMDAVREGLEISEQSHGSAVEPDMRSYVSYAAPVLNLPDAHPLARVIAIDEIRESLSASGSGGLFIVLRTDQPWDDIRQKLVDDEGYVEQADGAVAERSSDEQADGTLGVEPRTQVFASVAQVDGRIIVTFAAEPAGASSEPNGDVDDLLDLLEAAPGPIRAGILVDGGGCGQEVAVSTNIPVTGGTWTIGVGLDPSEDRVTATPGSTGGRRGQLIVQEPSLDGEYLQLPTLFDESIVDTRPDSQGGLVLWSVLQQAYGTDARASSMTPLFDTYDCSLNVSG